MPEASARRYTVKWALFGFDGRIGRKTFALGALLLLLVQAALFAYAAQYAGPETGPGQVRLDGADAFLVGLALLASWGLSAWAILALSVKRLHDLGLPGILAGLLLIPAISFFVFLFMAFAPSRPETNEHGAPPFPRS